MTEALRLAASGYATEFMSKFDGVARSHDRHWWAGVALYLWTAFLVGNAMGEVWRLVGANTF